MEKEFNKTYDPNSLQKSILDKKVKEIKKSNWETSMLNNTSVSTQEPDAR